MSNDQTFMYRFTKALMQNMNVNNYFECMLYLEKTYIVKYETHLHGVL